LTGIKEPYTTDTALLDKNVTLPASADRLADDGALVKRFNWAFSPTLTRPINGQGGGFSVAIWVDLMAVVLSRTADWRGDRSTSKNLRAKVGLQM
jgi:hypothetical protein